MLAHPIALLVAVALGAGCLGGGGTRLWLRGCGAMEGIVRPQQLVRNGCIEEQQYPEGKEEKHCNAAHKIQDRPETICGSGADGGVGSVAIGLHTVAGYGDDGTARVI